MASRNPEDLIPPLQNLYHIFHDEMHGAGAVSVIGLALLGLFAKDMNVSGGKVQQ